MDDVTEKIGIVIGMVLYGAIDQYFGSMRYSVIFLTIFFIINYFLYKSQKRMPVVDTQVQPFIQDLLQARVKFQLSTLLTNALVNLPPNG